jgi:hypothetical protein
LPSALHVVRPVRRGGALGRGETAEGMVRALAETYVAGLRARYLQTGKSARGRQRSAGW